MVTYEVDFVTLAFWDGPGGEEHRWKWLAHEPEDVTCLVFVVGLEHRSRLATETVLFIR